MNISVDGNFFRKNYNYIWLKAMLKKARENRIPKSTLITGSSYGLGGVYEPAWENAINCCGESQDLYYDFQVLKGAVTKENTFEKCFLILGYYAAFVDISKAKEERKELVGRRYYPIFHDSHNWKNASEIDLFEGMYHTSEKEENFDRKRIEDEIENAMIQLYYKNGSTYYAKNLIKRGTIYYENGAIWPALDEKTREKFAIHKTQEHLELLEHEESVKENTQILENMIHFLKQQDIVPAIIIPPFTKNYLNHIDTEFEKTLLQIVDSISEDVIYVDFNKFPYIFDDSDFLDPDHLNEKGGKKFSTILTMMFGK